MRSPLVTTLLLALATSLLGQTPPTPQNNQPRIQPSDTQRSLDEIGRRQQRDAPLLKNPLFVEAIRDYPGKFPPLQSNWGEFMTAKATQFVALQFAPSPGVVLKPGSRVVIFGKIVDPEGHEITTFEESTGVERSRDDVYVERVLQLPGGKLTGTFGIAAGGEIQGLTRIEFNLERIVRDGPGISRLLLSDNVYVLPAAQKPLDPFAFGGTKVVPKPGATFKKGAEIWLFAELRNPALDASKKPHVMTKIEVEGNGKRISAPASEAEALPLKGVEGHFGVGTTLDSSRLKSGDYTVRFTVLDGISKSSWTREAQLHLVD
jgi:hypothetical protein